MKTALVTGGGKGIGAAIARHLLAQNYSVAVVELDASLKKSQPPEVLFIHADVRNEHAVKNFIEQIHKQFGRIDALINNAGLLPDYLPSPENLPLETWKAFIDTNLSAPFLCSKYAIPYLRQHRGSIVNIASTRAFQSEPNDTPYAASKGGLVSLTQSLAISLGPAIRVNCICPGWIDTGHEKIREIDQTQHPVGRIGKPEDIAAMAAFLISEQAGFITGQSFLVDGGMTKKMIYVE